MSNRKPHFSPKSDPRFPHYQIYLHFTYQPGKRLRYYTGLTVPKEAWDTETERATRKSADNTEINQKLRSIEAEAERIATKYQVNQKDLSPTLFKKELDNFLNKKTAAPIELTFFQFFLRIIEERAANPNYSNSSIKVYRTTYNHLTKYAESVLRRDLSFIDFNHTFFVNFSNHLFGQGFGNNYVHKLTSTLKTLLKEADRRDISEELKIKDGWLVAKREEPPAIYLTEEDLDKLAAFPLEHNERLNRVRDLFLIGCYTGLRFSDFTQLKRENIKQQPDGRQFIEMATQKTGAKVTIPINSKLRAILAKYDNNPPKPISNQKFNDYLKELGKLAGLEESILLTRFRNGERLDDKQPKYELISTHTARRSFATNAYKSGVPAKYIMAVTGHKTEREFFKYVRMSADEQAVLVSDLPFFK